MAAAAADDSEVCPSSYLDPVSFELMLDPVLTEDGHTFERQVIEEWLRTHDTSPLYGGVLTTKTLIPNITLRKAICEWRETHHKMIPRSAIKMGEQVGRGSFKKVFKGELSLPGTRKSSTVAVLEVQRGDVATEVETLLKLGRHPRLVQFMGQCRDSDDAGTVLLVMEYAPLGALDAQMEEIEDSLTPGHRLAMLQQVCSGMEALAEARLIHRDLALRNVLLFRYDPNDVTKTSVKVSDFGLTVHACTATAKYVEGGARPIRWMSPEALQKNRYSEKSDVWAFGITAWELMTDGQLPYYAILDDALVAHVVGGGRVEPPEGRSDLVWAALEPCFCKKARDRPTFAELGVALGRIPMPEGTATQPTEMRTEQRKAEYAEARLQEEQRRADDAEARLAEALQSAAAAPAPAAAPRSPAPPDAVFQVHNCEVPKVDGTYRQDGSFNGKPQYKNGNGIEILYDDGYFFYSPDHDPGDDDTDAGDVYVYYDTDAGGF